MFAVKPCSAWAIANLAVSRGRQSFAILFHRTPSNCASKRLQRVTQWMSCVELVRGSSLNCAHVSSTSSSTSPKTRKVHVARSTLGTAPACSTGHFLVMYCPGGSRSGSNPAARTFFSASDLNMAPYTSAVSSPAVTKTYVRPRAFVAVTGPDAGDLLQRVVSNDVLAGDVCEALLLTPKGRVIAPLVVWRRGEEDFLLLTEPELGATVRDQLRRARIASRCEIELEEHTSALVFGEADGIPTRDYGVPAV